MGNRTSIKKRLKLRHRNKHEEKENFSSGNRIVVSNQNTSCRAIVISLFLFKAYIIPCLNDFTFVSYMSGSIFAWWDVHLQTSVGPKTFHNFKSKKFAMTRTGAIRTQIPSSKLSRELIKTQKVKIQREHMVNRVSGSFPKGGHSAT